MDIFKWLDKQEDILDYEVLEFRQHETAFYWKLKIMFSDNSVLFTKEYISESVRKYSFHWQTEQGDLKVRWDNAPHFPHIRTHPHHKHISTEENVAESYDISLEDVLTYIFSHLSL